MAHAICLQDWITAGGAANVSQQQTNEKYADLSLYRDIAIYIEIAQLTPAGPGVYVQSSPNREDAYFQTMTDVSGTATSYFTTGMQVLRYVRFADTPGARFVRWLATGGASWNITFRIWLSCNQARGAALAIGGTSTIEAPSLHHGSSNVDVSNFVSRPVPGAGAAVASAARQSSAVRDLSSYRGGTRGR